MENENNFGLSAEDREALDAMKAQKAEQKAQEEISSRRGVTLKGITDDEGTKLLYDSYGLKEMIGADESILDSNAAIKLAIKDAQSKLKAEMDANTQRQNQPTETPPLQASEPARQQVSLSSSQGAQPTDGERLNPMQETMESLKAKGFSTGQAAVALKFNRRNTNLT